MLLLIKLNPLLYYERYSNFNDMILLNNKPLYSYTWLDNNLYLLHLIQQQIYLYNDTWYSNLYMMILDTAISSINLQQWFSKLYYALMILLIQNINNLSSTTNLWHGTLNIIHEQGDRLPAAGGPPTDAHTRSGSEDATPLSKTMNFVLLYWFFSVLPFVLLDIHYPKTHKPRGRASDVSTISTCFSLCYHLLPTPPPISLRTAGGITVVYLCGF